MVIISSAFPNVMAGCVRNRFRHNLSIVGISTLQRTRRIIMIMKIMIIIMIIESKIDPQN